jgi:hypothetical protein
MDVKAINTTVYLVFAAIPVVLCVKVACKRRSFWQLFYLLFGAYLIVIALLKVAGALSLGQRGPNGVDYWPAPFILSREMTSYWPYVFCMDIAVTLALVGALCASKQEGELREESVLYFSCSVILGLLAFADFMNDHYMSNVH